jgi:hemerythrin-like domain-containing protein
MPGTNLAWADSPFPLIPTPSGKIRDLSKLHGSVAAAQMMTYIHNCLLRSLNSIYQQAIYVKTESDIRDLLLLTKLWESEIHHHHSTEEEYLFPLLEKLFNEPGIMDANVEQHEQFEPGLAALKKYAEETSPDQYDGYKLRAIIDEFGVVLQRHLTDEIQTLLSLKNQPSHLIHQALEETHKHALKTCDPVSFTRAVPIISPNLILFS